MNPAESRSASRFRLDSPHLCLYGFGTSSTPRSGGIMKNRCFTSTSHTPHNHPSNHRGNKSEVPSCRKLTNLRALRMTIGVLSFIAYLILISGVPLVGQAVNGTLLGTLTDSSG